MLNHPGSWQIHRELIRLASEELDRRSRTRIPARPRLPRVSLAHLTRLATRRRVAPSSPAPTPAIPSPHR